MQHCYESHELLSLQARGLRARRTSPAARTNAYLMAVLGLASASHEWGSQSYASQGASFHKHALAKMTRSAEIVLVASLKP